MNLFGLVITTQKALAGAQPVSPGSGGWFSIIRESFAGAWQRNVEVRVDSVLSYSAVFRCISLISSDIAKMRIRLVEQDENGIWTEVRNSAHSPTLRRPNFYQNRIQFFTKWMESKLVHGNTYVLKERDARNVVTRMHVLDPQLVTVLVAPDGSVYYELQSDHLSGLREESVTVPASEIIHDRWNTIHHPLVGTSPIHACGLAATQGLHIQNNSARFFGNGSNPGGILLAPEPISDEQAKRLKDHWEQNYTGANVGKVAVLGGGLKYEAMTVNASDAQLLEQLKWTAETVASVFGVPAYKIGASDPPTYQNNIEALNVQYYSQCLQIHIESIEEGLDIGLELKKGENGRQLGTEFDLDDLLRMDSATQMKVASDGVRSGILKPDEARSKFSLKPVPGGDTPYMQEQQWPLRHLSERELPSRPVTAPEEIADDGGGDDEGRSIRTERRNLVYVTAQNLRQRAEWRGRCRALDS